MSVREYFDEFLKLKIGELTKESPFEKFATEIKIGKFTGGLFEDFSRTYRNNVDIYPSDNINNVLKREPPLVIKRRIN